MKDQTQNLSTPPYIQSIYYNLISSRNMLVSDFQAASSSSTGLGFCDNLKSILKSIAEIEMQINVLVEIHPTLTSSTSTGPENSSSHGVISGEETSLYEDAKVVSKF
tara:strand:- start:303 stop:623 length:321 start_codon:yes stop_codon:yes gene_type:complete